MKRDVFSEIMKISYASSIMVQSIYLRDISLKKMLTIIYTEGIEFNIIVLKY